MVSFFFCSALTCYLSPLLLGLLRQIINPVTNGELSTGVEGVTCVLLVIVSTSLQHLAINNLFLYKRITTSSEHTAAHCQLSWGNPCEGK